MKYLLEIRTYLANLQHLLSVIKPKAAIVDVRFAVFLFLDELCIEISARKTVGSHKAATMWSTTYHIILLCPFYTLLLFNL